MAKAKKYLVAAFTSSVAMLGMTSPAYAGDFFENLGDSLQNHVERSFNDALRDSRREASRNRRDAAQRRRDQAAYNRSLRDREYMRRTAPANSDCTQTSSASSNGYRARNNVRQNCTQKFSTNGNGQPYYATPNGEYPSQYQHGYYNNYPHQQPRQLVSERTWDRLVDKCNYDLRHKFPGSSHLQREVACERGLSRYYTVDHRRRYGY